MSLIITHDDKVEITGLTKDNSYHDVDLSGYVSDGCLAVSLQFVNASTTTTKTAGYMTAGNSTNKDISLVKKSHQLFVAKLDASYSCQLKCQDSNVNIFIQAEFFEGVVLWDSDDYVLHQVDASYIGGFWYTLTLTLDPGDSYDDVEAVLIKGNYGSTILVPFGVRPLGSTEATAYVIAQQLFTIPVKTNDNGQFQIYFPTPSLYSLLYKCEEIGYIKKGYGFTALLEPENLSLSVNADWEDLDLSSILPEYSILSALRVNINQVNSDKTLTNTACIRAKGSSNPIDTVTAGIWEVYWGAVDDSRFCEYQYAQPSGGYTVDFSVWGYLVEEPPPPEPEIPPEVEDLPANILDRFVASLGPILIEVLNLTNITDGDSIVSQIQHPEYGFAVITTDETAITTAVNLSISGRDITINSADLTGDHDLIVWLFGF